MGDSMKGNVVDGNESNYTNETTPKDEEDEGIPDALVHVQDTRNENLAQIEIVVLAIILCIAVLGNALMLFALRRLLKYRPMSRMYFFMFNLSVADLLVGFGNILPQLIWEITYRFVGNDLLCRTVKFVQVFVLYLSTYILTFMAVDRYLVVCHHSLTRTHYNVRGLKGPKLFVVLAWLLSSIFALPQIFIFGYNEVKKDVYDCWADFVVPWGEQAYVVWFVSSAFALPLLIIGASYGAICCKVISFNLPKPKKVERPKLKDVLGRRKQFYSFSSTSGRGGDSDSGHYSATTVDRGLAESGLNYQISQARIKSVKLTLVIVICFMICWAPFCITQLILAFIPPTNVPVEPIAVILVLLASLNSCTNPWIYLAFSETLFNQLRVCLGIGMGRGSSEESIGDEEVKIQRPICKIIVDPADPAPGSHAGSHNSSSKSSDEHPIVHVQMETKSEII